jgi:3-phosphoshikimate 1-carboxyvinyltransferase
MNYTISHPSKNIKAEISLPPSKSISNRALIIQALCQETFTLFNLSESSDTKALLEALNSRSKTIDVGDAGTTMRFLTAFLSQKDGDFVLTGSHRMKERPIKELVDSLHLLGADIQYLGKEGYPPLAISGKTLKGGEIEISSSISSQFVTALLLIAPTLEDGLTLTLKGEILSKPYITMTLSIMRYFGVNSKWKDNKIRVKPKSYTPHDLSIEGDWSALAFILECAVFSDSADLIINGLFEESWQGDSLANNLFEKFGLSHTFEDNKLHISKGKNREENDFDVNLIDTPDLAQAYCCTLAGLKQSAKVSGLNNLKLKESHRLKALQNELQKIGQYCEYTENSIFLKSSEIHAPKLAFDSHNDHRMAMCLAPLATLFEITLNDGEVVKKSYPKFWEDMRKMGFTVSPLAHSSN